MRIRHCSFQSPLLIALATLVAVETTAVASAEERLWYDRPASKWTEALPLGNGSMGAMVFGGVEQARYQFNDDTLWVGAPHEYQHPGAHEHLDQIRSLLFAGKQKESERLAAETFMSVPLRQMSYQPCGNLILEFSGHADHERFQRELDLGSAIARTRYRADGVDYVRESFVSFPAKALILRLAAVEAGKLSFTARVESPHDALEISSIDEQTLLLSGQVSRKQGRKVGNISSQMTFACHLQILETDGEVKASNDKLHLTNASPCDAGPHNGDQLHQLSQPGDESNGAKSGSFAEA